MACAPQSSQVETRNIMGMDIQFDARPGDIEIMPDMMIGFSMAFAQRDAAFMQKYVTDDFRWHMNFVDGGPEGKTLSSMPEVMTYLAARDEAWENGVYTDHHFYAASDKVFHTYHLKGSRVDTGGFEVNGVDIYTLQGGKIATKDSYWKRGPF